nr:immunoglobulin light chain junction region [Macaca mulatta]MOX69038.1 immunoglobulin light chain junction region [Macaca mulatta]MOX69106.1 immunoglobulin light chain junction region [Macaca mulatta]MOX69120.1 immunoglobulin light chain junction region [Macaca mulatta]MOX69189.1 immunoglobulin light chain junction region [Macaca mulatta]
DYYCQSYDSSLSTVLF